MIKWDKEFDRLCGLCHGVELLREEAKGLEYWFMVEGREELKNTAQVLILKAETLLKKLKFDASQAWFCFCGLYGTAIEKQFDRIRKDRRGCNTSYIK